MLVTNRKGEGRRDKRRFREERTHLTYFSGKGQGEGKSFCLGFEIQVPERMEVA